MKVYLFLKEKIMNFSLPVEVEGSFSFDENPYEESKLINIEARDGKWMLYSTTIVNIIQNNSIVGVLEINPNSFYIVRRNNQNYLIYIAESKINNTQIYSYNNNVNIIIGNTTDANIQYPCPLLNNIKVKINIEDNKIVLEQNSQGGIYLNNNAIVASKNYINIGDQINIYGLKIMFLNGIILINNPGNKLIILEQLAGITKYIVPQDSEIKEIEIKDIDLYNKNDYFSKSPRIRRSIERKKITIASPPNQDDQNELPIILTIGPMLTMGVTSVVMLIDNINKIATKQTTFKDSWTTIVTSVVMLTSMLLWPILINFYNKRLKRKNKEKVRTTYLEYLKNKKQELVTEQNIQKSILTENLVSLSDCLDIIRTKNMKLWDKRTDQNDFLTSRIGVGNELLDVEIDFKSEEFKIQESELDNQAKSLVEQFRYIENVPLGYSFYENKITAVMDTTKYKDIHFINNIILQFITFYSYEDLKIVILTNEVNKDNWEYVKYLNHNFSDDKSTRFFSSTAETLKTLSEYFNQEINNRMMDAKKDDKEESNNEENKTPTKFKPYYLIIIDDYDRVKSTEFIKNITETELNLGVSIIIMEKRLSKLPSKCRNFISLGSTKSGILKNSYDKQEQIQFTDEIATDINMMEVSKILSNIPIEFETGVKELPDAISFIEMEKVGKVEQLNILNRWHTNNSVNSLKTEIGVDNKGDYMYLDIHEKFHGPHGLIAGTTGSGKSEFIITYILSLCINYSPDDVAFILIDYKGGGLALAFENKTTGISLPHLAGTITNLDKAEMDRTLVSIDSEVKKRQRAFNEARDKLGESTMDIYKYQRHYKEGNLTEPIPHLFIICDEFAELKSQQPDFMENLISVARIGRSLGVHLILATQKPSGVVNDQIWSNTKFRVCLKVQDEADSKEMLKRPEAAYLKQAGRFYLQVGYDEYFELGQSGWCGAKYYPSDTVVKQVDKSIDYINDSGEILKSYRDNGNEIKIEAQGEQLAAIMKNIVEVANKTNKKARRLWLENIPAIILVDDLEKKYNIISSPYNFKVVIGEYDAPEKQEQGVVIYDYIENGNTLIYGTDSTENEKVLKTLIYSTTKNHTADEVNYYIIDYGSESLRKFSKLPQVGGVVLSEESEKLNNLIKMIKEEVIIRKKKFIDSGGEYQSYIKSSNEKLPIKVIILNNFASYYEENPEAYEYFGEIVRDSGRYGIIFILTATAVNVIPNKITQSFNTTYAYKLKDPMDYFGLFSSKTKIIPRDIEGRGLFFNDGVHEFQTASIIDDEEQLNSYLTSFINNQRQTNKSFARKIPSLPDIVRAEDVQHKILNLNSVPIGINKHSLEVSTIDILANIGTIISSMKLTNTTNFVKSLLYIFKVIPNTTLMIIDPMKNLLLDKQKFPYYYTEEMDKSLQHINDYIEKNIKEELNNEGIILIYGFNKFVNSLENNELVEKLSDNLKKYEKIGLVIVEESKKLSDYQYDKWYKDIFIGDGIWVGKGVLDQNIIKTSTYNKEVQASYKNDMGFNILEGEATLVKFIDFITQNNAEENDEK